MFAFKQISTDTWMGRLDDITPAPDEKEHLAHVADEYGIDIADIARVEVKEDPRDLGTCVRPPDRLVIDPKLIALASATTVDELKDALIDLHSSGIPREAVKQRALTGLVEVDSLR